jgi:hypothetical protein
MAKQLQGEVIEVSDNEVVVRFDTGDDIMEQTYDLDQFTLGKAPAVGDQLAIYVHVAVVQPPPAGPVKESQGETYRSRGRKPARRRPLFIPRLDALEDRTLLSAVSSRSAVFFGSPANLHLRVYALGDDGDLKEAGYDG